MLVSGYCDARDAVRPIVLGDASADGVLVVEPHRQDAGPDDRVAGAAAEAPLALTELGERDVGRVVVRLRRLAAGGGRVGILCRRPAAFVRRRREVVLVDRRRSTTSTRRLRGRPDRDTCRRRSPSRACGSSPAGRGASGSTRSVHRRPRGSPAGSASEGGASPAGVIRAVATSRRAWRCSRAPHRSR